MQQQNTLYSSMDNSTENAIAERILDTALEQAESKGWDSVNLHAVASTLDISLQEIKDIYPQKDDLVEAWFDRADKTILSKKASEEFTALAAHERVHQLMMSWFMSMSAHRRITRQMLCYKLELGHIHLQVLGIMRISRTVQWFREAALLNTDNIHRVIEEILLTRIYLITFTRWLFDDSKNSLRTDRYLQAALKRLRSLK